MSYDINLKYLEYFVRTAKIGSINKAAQALFISQPHLGKIIRELEDHFGVPLFNRSNQGVTLTPEGKHVLNTAIEILGTLDRLKFRTADGEAQYEHLSVSMTKFSHIMEAFLEVVLLHQNQPSFVHRLYEGIPDDVCDDVLSGRSDIGVLHFIRSQHTDFEKDLSAKGLCYHFLAYVEPHIVISKKHPLILQNRPVNMQTLSEYGFIRYLGQYDDLFPALFNSQDGVEPRKVVYVSTRSSVMRLISESSFYSVGIYDFDGQSAYDVISIPIPVSNDNLRFEFGYVTMKGLPISDMIAEFIAAVKKRIH